LPIHPCRALLLGRSTMGKTTLLINTLVKTVLPQVDRVIIISPTYGLDKKWRIMQNTGKDPQVYYDFNDDVSREITLIIGQNVAAGMKTLVVLDDLTRATRTGKSSESQINRLIANCIWENTSVFVSCQNLVHSTIELRNNVDIVYLFQTQNRKELKLIDEVFGFGDFDQFRKLLNFATKEPYSFLQINRQGPTIKYYKQFKTIKFAKPGE
jgi:hypothetical protein